MTNDLEIPSVTQDDLLAFHTCTFGDAIEPTAEQSETVLKEEDDGLGYYADGVKRTLTDAEIAIFRHSEIHALRLRLERQREAAEATPDRADGRSEGELSEGEIVSDEEAAVGEPKRDPENAENNDYRNGEEPQDDLDEDDDAAYATFLQQERKEFELAAQQRRQQQKTQLDPYDRSISTRRRIRELDSIKDNSAVLNYGDEESTIEPTTTSSHTDEKTQPAIEGRKIWWPELGVKVKFFEDG